MVEGYAFNTGRRSASGTQLAELGGVLRAELVRRGFALAELPPSCIKRCFSGSGDADKRLMWEAFGRVTGGGCTLADWIPGSFKVDVPSPHQDIVDAFAIVHVLHRLPPPAP